MAVVKARDAKRGDVHLIGLDSTRGREIKKTRPCVIISPDQLNAHLQTVTIAPLTSSGKAYPFRVPCVFDKKQGLIVLDQMRTVDRERLLRRLGAISEAELDSTLALLREMFEA
jgi:mRNA interferase MazF